LSGWSVGVRVPVFIAVTWKFPTFGMKTGEVTPSQLTFATGTVRFETPSYAETAAVVVL
jgi:hypothetical protein